MADLEVFLKNMMNEWALPNPDASGPEYFLPAGLTEDRLKDLKYFTEHVDHPYKLWFVSNR